MEINVTQGDIDAGDRCNGYHCPIALAVRRRLAMDMIQVSPSILEVYIDNTWKSYSLPKEATEFIQNFDKGKEVHPFTFIAEERNKILSSS